MNTLQLFNDNGLRTFGDLFNDFFTEMPRTARSFYPRTNIHETENSYEVEMLAPGRKKEDFKISLDHNLLTVSFEEKKEKKEENGKKLVSREYSFHSFSRSFTLDENVDVDKIEAKYENGVLGLTIPKKAEVKASPKQIAIQ